MDTCVNPVYAFRILPHRAAFFAIHRVTPRCSAMLVYDMPNLRRCNTFSEIFPVIGSVFVRQIHLDGDLGGGSNSIRWGAPVFPGVT